MICHVYAQLLGGLIMTLSQEICSLAMRDVMYTCIRYIVYMYVCMYVYIRLVDVRVSDWHICMHLEGSLTKPFRYYFFVCGKLNHLQKQIIFLYVESYSRSRSWYHMRLLF